MTRRKLITTVVLLFVLVAVGFAAIRTISDGYIFDKALYFASSETTSPDAGIKRTGAGALALVDGFGTSGGASLATGNVTVATAKTLAVTDADKLTVGSKIVPQLIRASFQPQTTEAATDRVFFLADRAYLVVGCTEIHSVAAGGASVLQVVKDTSTDAPGAGTDLLTNNTNTGFDLNGTANTLQTGTLTATAASKTLAAGDRLSIDFGNTIQSTAGLVVQCTLQLQ